MRGIKYEKKTTVGQTTTLYEYNVYTAPDFHHCLDKNILKIIHVQELLCIRKAVGEDQDKRYA